MKRIYNILVIFSLIAISCSQYDITGGQYKTIQVTFHEYMDTKVSLMEKEDDSGLALSWEQSDKLLVVGETTETYTLTAIDGKKATFTGKEVKGNVFDVILTRSEDYKHTSFIAHTQTGVHATNHLEYDACLIGVNAYDDVKFTHEWAKEHGGKFMQTGCLLLYFQLPTDATAATVVNQVKVETSSPVFYVNNTEASLKSSTLEVDIDNGIIGVDRTVRAYMMTSMHEAVIPSNTGLRITVVTDKGTYYKDVVLGEGSIVPGKRNIIKLNSKNWHPIVEYKNFTFMTYNVGRFKKYKDKLGYYSYPEVAAVMKHYGVDIVGLNEIELSTTDGLDVNNQPKELTNQLGGGWNYYFAPANNDKYGNAIVAAPGLTPINFRKMDLPRNNEEYQLRSLGVVEYEDFIFCVTHLDHHSRDERAPQIQYINSWIKENYGNSDKPIILTGDMNATPGSQEIKGRPNKLDLEGFGDYWDFVSVTKIDGKYVTTYPNDPDNPNKCIDYIFIWRNNALEYTVNKTEVIDSYPSINMAFVSDHYPVYADMTFTKTHPVDPVNGQIQGGVDSLPNAPIYEEEF